MPRHLRLRRLCPRHVPVPSSQRSTGRPVIRASPSSRDVTMEQVLRLLLGDPTFTFRQAVHPGRQSVALAILVVGVIASFTDPLFRAAETSFRLRDPALGPAEPRPCPAQVVPLKLIAATHHRPDGVRHDTAPREARRRVVPRFSSRRRGPIRRFHKSCVLAGLYRGPTG